MLIVFLGINLTPVAFEYCLLRPILPYAEIKVYSLCFSMCMVITSGLRFLEHGG